MTNTKQHPQEMFQVVTDNTDFIKGAQILRQGRKLYACVSINEVVYYPTIVGYYSRFLKWLKAGDIKQL